MSYFDIGYILISVATYVYLLYSMYSLYRRKIQTNWPFNKITSHLLYFVLSVAWFITLIVFLIIYIKENYDDDDDDFDDNDLVGV